MLPFLIFAFLILLVGIEFADANTTIDQVTTDLLYDVATGGAHSFRINNSIVFDIETGFVNMPDAFMLQWAGISGRSIRSTTGAMIFEQDSVSDNFDWEGANTLVMREVNGSLLLLEKSGAQGDVGNYGQLWVLNTIPNALMFTDDTGVDSNLTRGVHDIPTTAASWFLPTLEPATGLTNINFATNDHDYKVFEFTSTTADERIQLNTTLPRNIDLSDIDVVIKWSFASGSGVVRWGIRAVGMGDNDALDSAWGTAIEANDTAGTAEQFQFVTLAALAVGGTPGEGDEIAFEVYREGVDAADTFTGTARIHSITFQVRKVRASAEV